MRILVLDLHIAQDPRAALQIFNAVNPHCPGTLDVRRFYSPDFRFPILATYDGIILSGLDRSRLLYSGKMQRLKAWIRQIDSEIQVFGICGGHQVLATAYGYPVQEIAPEVGWHSVRITEHGQSDPLFHGIANMIYPFHHHNKAAVQIPAEQVLAENERCIQAVLFRPHVRGVQFHPEYSSNNERLRSDAKHDDQDSMNNNQLWFQGKKQIFRNFVLLCER